METQSTKSKTRGYGEQVRMTTTTVRRIAPAMLTALMFALLAIAGARSTIGASGSDVVLPSASVWTPIGTGIRSFNFGDSKGVRHQCGRLIEAAWRYDNVQRQNVLWMGAAVGGLWKSIVDSNGKIQNWIPLTDNFPGPHSMGAFLVHRFQSNNILIGPGSLWDGSGDGNIYRTYRQGEKWYAKELPVYDGEAGPTRINRLVEDRSDRLGNTVLAATSTGIYRSTDFGITWQRVFRGLTADHADEVTDIVQDTGDPNIWYAAALVTNVILRNTHAGASRWWASYVGTDKITGPVGRVSLAACDADPNVLYALVVEPDSDTTVEGHLKGVYRSVNRARDWTRIFDNTSDPSVGNQGMHTCAIACDPSDPNHLVFGLKKAYEMTHAITALPASGFAKIDGGYADYNFMLFRPGLTSIVIANDGGYYTYDPIQQTVDDSGNLLGINAMSLETSQGGLASSRSSPDVFIAGLLDGGLVRGNAAVGILEAMIGKTDGGKVSIMPENPDVMAASGNGSAHLAEVTTDIFHWQDVSAGLPNQGDDKYPSMLIDTTPGVSNPLLFTHSQIAQSVNKFYYRDFLARQASEWQLASLVSIAGEISNLDHTTDPNSHTLIFTRKGDRSLFKLSGSRAQLGVLPVTDITPPMRVRTGTADAHANADKSHLKPHTLYYTTARARPSQVFVSVNDGVDWQDLTGDMSAVTSDPDFLKVVGNPSKPNQLFLATNKGIYRTDTGGAHWFLYSDGLRLDEVVQDIVINFDNQNPPTLFIATKGRGFWQIQVR